MSRGGDRMNKQVIRDIVRDCFNATLDKYKNEKPIANLNDVIVITAKAIAEILVKILPEDDD